ncbi:MAG TPA: hypothetical protein VNW92_10180 [Polyangiaceae bacterium]|jgi:hypothetical protein|nr:hypothetical protein [Polyangiaceae bacterium]
MRLWLSLSQPAARSLRRGRCFAPLLLLVSCGGAAQSAGGARAPASPNAHGAALGSSPAQPGTAPGQTPGSPTNAPLLPRLPELVLDPKQPLRPLPELKVENIGLHVGGGPNDAETKAPFQRAVAERFPAFLDCYRKNDDPAKGGRFGVDLHIARAGGHPRLEQPRTAMHGPEFRACVSAAFESVEFDKPKRGPTTISYALLFTLVDPP